MSITEPSKENWIAVVALALGLNGCAPQTNVVKETKETMSEIQTLLNTVTSDAPEESDQAKMLEENKDSIKSAIHASVGESEQVQAAGASILEAQEITLSKLWVGNTATIALEFSSEGGGEGEYTKLTIIDQPESGIYRYDLSVRGGANDDGRTGGSVLWTVGYAVAYQELTMASPQANQFQTRTEWEMKIERSMQRAITNEFEAKEVEGTTDDAENQLQVTAVSDAMERLRGLTDALPEGEEKVYFPQESTDDGNNLAW